MDQMLDRLARKGWYCYLDGYSGYNQISIASEDQEKTTFPCPYGTFSFKRMLFGLFNAPATFQRCMMSIFSDMMENTIEVFMNDFSVVGDKKMGFCEWMMFIVRNNEGLGYLSEKERVLGYGLLDSGKSFTGKYGHSKKSF
uniref:Reverse transcriptase domain-containing protein n=1 Tax=Solanum lycopersicum TaxID=4081 RepID=A0A3Q7GHY7_SOLLC